jgi:hypothetical protein
MTPYYYIHRPGTPGPTVKHPTRAAAQTEAQRLATKHPGVTFEILQCVGLSSTPVPTATTFWLDEADKPKPTNPAKQDSEMVQLLRAAVEQDSEMVQQLRTAQKEYLAAVKAYHEAEREARNSFLEHNEASYRKGRVDALRALIENA